jgi:hypothetical protein
LENVDQPTSNSATNEIGKNKVTTNKNQYHPLLNYLLENTPSKLKKLMLLVEKI